MVDFVLQSSCDILLYLVCCTLRFNSLINLELSPFSKFTYGGTEEIGSTTIIFNFSFVLFS